MNHESKKYFGGWPLTIAIGILLALALILTVTMVGPTEKGDDDTMKLGVLLPLTGDQKSIGNEYLKGIQLAVDDCKKNRVNIELVIKDTKSDTGTAIDNFLMLVAEGVTTIIGPSSANDAEKIALFAELYGINLITLANTENLDKYKNHLFKFLPASSSVASAIEIMINKMEGEKEEKSEGTICILYSKDTYGYTMNTLLTRAINKDTENQLKVKSIMIPENLDDGVADAVIKEVEDSSPLYVCVFTTNPEVYIALDNAGFEKLPKNVCWIGTDYILGKSVAQKLKNTDRTFILSMTRTMTNDFRNKYTAKFNQEPEEYSIATISYDAVSTLGTVVKTYGMKTDNISDGLKTVRQIGLTGVNKFDENGNRCIGFIPYVLIDGNWIKESWNNLQNYGEFMRMILWEISRNHTRIQV